VTIGKSKERNDRISKAHMLSLREIISEVVFESDFRALLRKPAFFLVTPSLRKIGSCVTEIISVSAR